MKNQIAISHIDLDQSILDQLEDEVSHPFTSPGFGLANITERLQEDVIHAFRVAQGFYNVNEISVEIGSNTRV